MTVFKDNNAKKNKWYFVIEVRENGKRKRIKRRGFARERDARIAERKLLNELEQGLDLNAADVTYEKYMNDWLKDKKGSVKPQTYTTYHSIVTKHILPVLGSYTLNKITPRLIQNLYNDIKDKRSLSGENLQKVHTIIKGSLQKAVDWGMIIKNPAALVERPKSEREEMMYWTHEQSLQFLEVAKNDRYYHAFLLAITTGMRQGEILALRWKDINFESKTIHVRGTLDHQGKGIQAATKTKAGMRSIGIDGHTLKQLKKLRERTLEEKMKNRDIYEDKDMVFSTELGNHVHPRNLLRSFYRLVEKAGVPKIRFHDLRHTHVVFLLEMRENNKRIAERLGWSSVKMLDRYAHITAHMQQETADAFGDKFYSAPNGTKNALNN